MKQFLTTILYQPLYNILIFLAWLVPGHSIGWAIIILTILIRLALWKSSIQAARSQAKLQALQPKINKLRGEIKDQQLQGRALMQLYKDEGVSPFGACLPLLIQLPILIILYRVFIGGLDTGGMHLIYSFVPHMDTINTYWFGLDLTQPEKWVMPILAGILQFFLSKMTMPPAPKVVDKDAPADPMAMMNKQMIYLFPLMTIFIGRSVPAALALYWVITTLFGVIQQYYVNTKIKKEHPAHELDNFNVEKYKNLPASAVGLKGEKEKIKSDYTTKIMRKRLDKQEKKKGVEVTIRKKGK